jgi:hypothetical protein
VKVKIHNRLYASLEWARAFFWRRQALYSIVVFLFLGIVVFQLSVIPNKFSTIEVSYAAETRSISSIAKNTLSLPHKLSSYGTTFFSESTRSVRAVSIIFYGFCVIAIYRSLKRWHSSKVALYGSALFATNATALAIGRLAAPLVLLFGWSIVISLLLWTQHGSSRRVAPFTLFIVSSALLYVPGAPYFFLLLLVIFGDKIRNTIKQIKHSSLYTAIGAGLLVITPLILSFTSDADILKQWLLLPNQIDWRTIPLNILQVPSAFVYRQPADSLISVGRLPIFDVAAGGLFLIGLYAYQKHIKLERTRIMMLTALLGVLIGALGQVAIATILLLPFAYSIVAAGISYVLDEWYAVFPKNPFARSFGLLLVTTVVLISMYFQLTKFLVVWPQVPETRATYDQSGLIQ